MNKSEFKQKALVFWKTKAVPFFKTEHGVKNWVVLAIAVASFIAGAWWF